MDLFTRTEDLFAIAIAGVVDALLFVMAMLRQFLPLKPVPLLREDWMRFEQRRWSNPGATLREVLCLVFAIVIIGGTIAVPWWLGIARSPGWYLNEWCRSAQLAQAMRKGEPWETLELPVVLVGGVLVGPVALGGAQDVSWCVLSVPILPNRLADDVRTLSTR